MKAVLASRNSLAILGVAAFAFAAGTGFASLAWATIPEVSQGHDVGYYRADGWLHATAFLSISGAVLLAGWPAIRSRVGAGEDRAEIVGAVLAGLVVSGGYGRIAATTPYDSPGHLVVTIGLALWAPLALVHGLRHNATSRSGDRKSRLLSVVWSAAGLGLLVNAVGFDFVPVGIDARTNGMVSTVLAAVGAALVAWALIVSRSHGWLSSRSSGIVAAGLVVLMVCDIGDTVVSAIELGSSPTFTGIKLGYALVFGGSAVAVLTVGMGAWGQRRHVSGPRVGRG